MGVKGGCFIMKTILKMVVFGLSFCFLLWMLMPVIDFIFARFNRGVTYSIHLLLLPLILVGSFLLTQWIYEKVEDAFRPYN